MSGENETRRKKEVTKNHLPNICALLITAAAIIQPFRNVANTTRAIEALRGNDISCTDGVEPRNKEYPFDAIAVPGAGIIGIGDSRAVPSDAGRMRLQAAAIAYMTKMAPFIILLDGTVKPHEKWVDYDYLQQAYKELSESDEHIPGTSIIIENNSTNTATNMSELAAIAERNKIQKVLIVTNAFHEKRAVLFACNFGVHATSVSAERFLVNQDPLAAHAILAMYESQTFKNAHTKEQIELALAILDPEGYLPTALRKIEGGLR